MSWVEIERKGEVVCFAIEAKTEKGRAQKS